MDNNKEYTTPEKEEEEGIDIMALIRSLWDGRKTILICTGIFIVLGLVAALSMKRTYSVTTVMVPQMGDNKSGLGGLAALAGFDMGSASTNGELSPLIYPQIVNSVPFRLEMMHTPLHYQKCDTLISMFDYAKAKYEKPSVFSYVKRYTIGLPGVILGSLGSKPKEVTVPGGNGVEDDSPKPIVVSMDEYKMLNSIAQAISLSVDKKEGYITLTVNGSEPIQTAELALKAQQLLQDEVTRFRIEKSQSELEYIQARYNEAKEEADRLQGALAGTTDRYQNVVTTSANVGKERLRTKFNVANTVYMELAKQLEQAKMKVKKDTPSFSIIEPVTIPMKPANSRAKQVFIWTFLGIVLGCGIVLVKGYWPKLKEKFAKPESEE
ncbi:MAG: lipopolysaccharide biosynthesis protein [Bacteroidales bacterium]|nr:lipopolysaccharide biosynthesis protein [Bacteroidales bacterium]